MYCDPKLDAMNAPVHKIETTKAGYEKLVDQVIAYLEDREDRQARGRAASTEKTE